MAARETAQHYVIRIDREGHWFYNGRPIIHPAVLRVFNDGLFLGEDNNHYLRVQDDIARIEVEADDFPKLLERRAEVVAALKSIGYVFVTLDLAGFRSGSMTEALGEADGA